MVTKLFIPGDRVKLIEIPPAVALNKSTFPETFAIFQRALERQFKVRNVDMHGHIELWLHEDGSEDATGAAHSIWVEPAYLAKANS